ncbi:nucleoside triphosphate pyrophosphohydrolase family protein [Micromonospora sp. CB01531]|uniref:nucleoside triphosphate pyrophosphohydrolase family protein n=1 Tax=Micromonospora sp. CB01531 TaxID=1718947 RepID=UPI000AF4AB39|nr:nucleoside triphosphate pyrophosphohydrolase family protein [Micromonospora sp. CB01531]
MRAYQRSAAKTIQPLQAGGDDLSVALLGLAGEAGAVLTAYKKQLRDGPSDPEFRARMREELGDVLWYLSTVAHHLELDLDDVATANLGKIADRWRRTPAEAIPFDNDLESGEQLPRRADFVFTLTRGPEDREMSVLTCNGVQVGDPITNASHIADGYCFHDIFHLSYAAVLGWSPVMRSLLKRKRRSNPQTDEAEDGGRAIAIEEGISALVFSYASRHRYLEGKNHVDNDVLDTIQGMVAHLEVGAHRTADWEKAILTGFAAWRKLRRVCGGTVHLDLDRQTLTVVEPDPPAGAAEETSAAETFKAVVAGLHRRKDASYGNSWKRRGELISIMANIARKVDRLKIVAVTLESTADENALDTAVDLYVYALKYLTFLADKDPVILAEVLPARDDGIGWSDGPEGVERLLAIADLAVLDTGVDEAIEDLVAALDGTFAELEDCFTAADGPAVPSTRSRLTARLADQAIRCVSALRADHPGLYRKFLQTWQKDL